MTLNGLLDVPPTSCNVTNIDLIDSIPVYCVCVNLTLILEESIITPVAAVIEPAITPGDDGTFNLIVNISSPSTMLSLYVVTFTVVLVALAGIVVVRVVVLKSISVSNI